MFVKQYMSGSFSADYIWHNFVQHGQLVAFARKGNTNIAILYYNQVELEHSLVFEEEQKVPLYKQAMAMQMGKMPKASTIQRRTYQVRYYKEDEISPHMRFEVYTQVY